MATYDPKRSRPVAALSRDNDADLAPIDAILGAVDTERAVDTEATVDLRAAAGSAPEPGATVPRIDSPSLKVTDSPIDVVPGPDRTTQRVAIVAGMAAATTALIVLWRRRQR